MEWQPLVDEVASPPFDFPKVNPLYRGKPYRCWDRLLAIFIHPTNNSQLIPLVSELPPACRYVWGACSTRPTNAHNSVAKFDTRGGTVQVSTLQ